MSKAKQETIADIVERVRRDCNSYPLPTAAAEMLKLVREMDAAHQREVAELWEENSEQLSENVRLRAALKPVLDISIDMNTSDLAMSMAIKKAKRIYNEGRESEAK